MSNPLEDFVKAQIRASGPLSVADYMALCLQHPEHGYYTTRDPLGAAGDFTTAPEISQMFGELIGAFLAQYWLDMGAPSRFTLAELGPGRGTLMADILRATRGVQGFHAAAELLLVESSPALRARQEEALKGYAPRWQDVFEAPDTPLLLVANEFFDALPVRQFVRDGSKWRERVIGLSEGALSFGLTDSADYSFLAHRLEDTQDGDLVERSAPSEAIISQIGDHIAIHGGTALIVDYGGWNAKGDSFQAVKAHQKVSPLHELGQADLTAHVDFAALARAASPAQISALVTQGVFLERLGITQRAQSLAGSLSGASLTEHIAAHRRLTHPEEMGSLFKVMALTQSGMPPPAGLEYDT